MKVPCHVVDVLIRGLGIGADKMLGFVKKQWRGYLPGACRVNYSIAVENGESYYIGIDPVLAEPSEQWTYVRVDFNPAKVGQTREFWNVYQRFLNTARFIDFKRFDVAIDFAVPRDRVKLIKDARLYKDYSYSLANRTEYLGKRDNHGQCKLYNKALEQKLSVDNLTRLEITMNYENCSYSEFCRVFPKVYICGADLPEKIGDTEYVLLLSCLEHPEYLKMLGRKMRKKIEPLVEEAAQVLKPNELWYKCILTDILQYGNIKVDDLREIDIEMPFEEKQTFEVLFGEQNEMRF